MAQSVKDLPAVRETWVRTLGWEDPLEEGKATQSSIPAWRISVDRGAWRATVHGVTKSQTGPSRARHRLQGLGCGRLRVGDYSAYHLAHYFFL